MISIKRVRRVHRFKRTSGKTQRARRLRQDSTNVERRLWYRLRNGQIDGHQFRRQHPAGPYVLDFYCPQLRLGIELDGGQHNLAGESRRDRERDSWFAMRGVTVLRFWNSDVTENMTGVLEKISIVATEVSQNAMTPVRRCRAQLPREGDGTSNRPPATESENGP
jgi:very-short-patch-repair endonuclease